MEGALFGCLGALGVKNEDDFVGRSPPPLFTRGHDPGVALSAPHLNNSADTGIGFHARDSRAWKGLCLVAWAPRSPCSC